MQIPSRVSGACIIISYYALLWSLDAFGNVNEKYMYRELIIKLCNF
jgi:hypothetical protein